MGREEGRCPVGEIRCAEKILNFKINEGPRESELGGAVWLQIAESLT